METGEDPPTTIPNSQRGCGYLKEGSAYLRADVGSSDFGVLPPFVRADPPIPYKEPHSRSWSTFPGIQFECATEGDVTEYVPVPEDDDQRAANLAEFAPFYDGPEDIPGTEIERHLDRVAFDGADADHVGSMFVSRSHDLLMWVGESHYDSAEEFIREAKSQGVNKRIPVSKNKVPVVKPGRTRLWLIHPNAIQPDDDEGEPTPGVIGYTYLSRTVYTEDEDGNIPEHIKSKERDGLLDVVEPGPEVPYSDEDHPRHDEFAEDEPDEDVDETEPEQEPEPEPEPATDPQEAEQAGEENAGESEEAGEAEAEDEDDDIGDFEPGDLAEEDEDGEGEEGEEDEDPDEDGESEDVDDEDEEKPDPISVSESNVPTVDDW